MDSRNNVASQFYEEAATAHMLASEELAKTFRADLIDFLYKNEGEYPLWMAGENYASNSASVSCKVIGGQGEGYGCK